ncbi:hypothetical protein GCM10017161_22000 [Thalassotalea marina]|uniref:diguanylate cyclase n=2 Tax=Thalassotalea marina TaxID=1673741 RepID=A0A919EKU9_9GAMM|nr:hypothetical protein GCM10017161_22000 [Thalassotalea marina]
MKGHGLDKAANYTILAVDDAKDSLMLLEFDLAESGYRVITAESGELALEIIKETDVSLVLLDIHMPGISGIDTLKRMQQEQAMQNVPVIMLSASGEEDAIVTALELGADDYITKPYIPKVLLARINNALRYMEKTKLLELLAKTDSLTGLNNRGAFQELSNACINQAQRENNVISFAMLDIDFFKNVNDKYGHDVGDKALVEFAAILKKTFRCYDVIGRVGGEEFAVCMPNTTIDEAYLACERCRATVESRIIQVDKDDKTIEFNITASIGITSSVGKSIHYDELVKNADSALYQAKRNGRNQTMLDGTVEPSDELDTADVMIVESQNMEKTMVETNSYPGIDYQIGVNNVLGDDNLFQEILIMFYQDHGDDGRKIALAISNGSYNDLKNLIHTLKGVACSIGAMTLFEHCKALDIAINESNSAMYEGLFQPVDVALSEVIAGIKERLIN